MSPQETQFEMLSSLATGEVVDIWAAIQRNAAGNSAVVAVKRVALGQVANPAFAQQIFHAAQKALYLRHPAIATVHEVTQEEDTFVITDLVRGEPLHALRKQAALPPAITVEIIAQAAAAAHFAHSLRDANGNPVPAVHAGLSPACIFLQVDGTVKVADFDWASIFLAPAASSTLVGPIDYASPEQCMGGRVDIRSDVYSLGVVLWELLTGRPLYGQQDEFELMEAIAEEQAPPPSQFNKAVPPFLDAIVAKAVAKNPAERFPDCERLHSSLAKVRERLQRALTAADMAAFLARTAPARVAAWRTLAQAEASGSSDAIAAAVEGLSSPAAAVRANATFDERPAQTYQGGFQPPEDTTTTDAFLGSVDVGPALPEDNEPTQMGPPPTAPRRSAEPVQEFREVFTERADSMNVLDDGGGFDLGELVHDVFESKQAAAAAPVQQKRPEQVSSASLIPDNADDTARIHGVEDQVALRDDENWLQELVVGEAAPSSAKPRETPLPVPPTAVIVGEKNIDRNADTRRHVPPSRDDAHAASGPQLEARPYDAELDDDDDDDDGPFQQPFDVDRMIIGTDDAAADRALARQKAIVEIVRHRAGGALGAVTLRGLRRTYKGPHKHFEVAHKGSAARIRFKTSVQGEVHRARGPVEPFSSGEVNLQVGDVAHFEDDSVGYHVRLYQPPVQPKAGWAPAAIAAAIAGGAQIYGVCAIAAIMLHAGALYGFETIGSMASLTVEAEPKAEVFAEGTLKKPEKAKKQPDKPKPKPQKKERPKPKKQKVEQKRPPDPTEQMVKIPQAARASLDKKMKERAARSGGGGKETKAETLVNSLTSPVAGNGQTIKDVVTNIDAPNSGSRSAAFRVAGTLGSLPSGGINIGTGGGGDLGALGGDVAAAKEVGKLTKRDEKGKGKVRGTVSSVKALAKIQGSLSPGDVTAAINSKMGKIQGCYERALINNPGLSGKITFEWTVKTTGAVGGCKEISSTLNDAKVSGCIIDVLKTVKFPKPTGGEVVIRYPFIFRSSN